MFRYLNEIDMRDRNSNATKETRDVRCMEVLISKRFIASRKDLLWTLSVYSLEHQPVKKNRELHNSEIYHFMVFDWERTIRNFLERNKVPYSIIEYFTPDSIFSESNQPEYGMEVDKIHCLSAVSTLEQTDLYTMAASPSRKSTEKEMVDSNL